MIELLTSVLVMLALMGCALGGIALQHRLPESHRDRRTLDSVLLVASMFVTFSALVLSLLTYSVQGSFEAAGSALRGYSSNLIQLNRELALYGPETRPARRLLRAYTAAAIASTWPGEPPPAGDYPRHVEDRPGSLESSRLGDMLHQAEAQIRHLQPKDAFHRQLAQDCLRQYAQLLQTRWTLIEDARSTVSVPFLSVLVLWLAILFVSFGLTAPRNKLVYVMISLCAFAIGTAIFVILEMATPLTGFIIISSQPMRDALAHMSPVAR
jgi:hypothetical protein